MKLSDIAEQIEGLKPLRVAGDVEISGLSIDSRMVEGGHLFAAIPGEQLDGRAFVGEALDRGAVAVLAPTGSNLDVGEAVLLEHDNPRKALSVLAGRFYDAQPDMLAAVTGTNGKTSVASFLRQIWQSAGKNAASIGTMGVESARVNIEGTLTTPDAITFQKNLAALSGAGVSHGVFEASSHGLDQYRLDGARISVAGFSNLSRDHLDYHGDMERYFAAKQRLFMDVLPAGGTAVINIDDPWGARLAEDVLKTGRKVITVGADERSDLRILDCDTKADGSQLVLGMDGAEQRVFLPLIGRFQADNAVLAAAMAVASGLELSLVIQSLKDLVGVAGRMELVGNTPEGGRVIIDYAHTPDGLKNALSAARAHTDGRLEVVFGCGGDRDAGKRPMMGEIACQLADDVYITDDNPRSENPASIRADVIAGAPTAIEIGDRALAISAAMGALSDRDMLLVTGKGHEQGQIIGDKTLPFSDLDVVRRVMGELKGAQS